MLSKRPNHTAVLRFCIDKAGKERPDRQRIDVARMDAAKQGFRDRGNRRHAKAAPEKRGNRLVLESATASNQWFKGEARTRERRQQVVGEEPFPCRRNAEHRWGWQGMQSAVLENESRAWDVRRDQSIAEIERFTQRDRRGLLRRDRVRSRLDRETVHVLRANDAPKPRRRFEELKRNAADREFVRSSKSRDAAANDCHHELIIVAVRGSRVRGAIFRLKAEATRQNST